ncbi:MAG: hypothetical protein QOK25_649 [Thermoleophilaceae bacterium]|jgi:hypothetical protein|nr:hypothetical protein [Thermoleophilaceae bacterium]
MADSADGGNGGLPPPAEQIHLPEPSYLPVTLALGITLAIVGVVLSPILTVLGLLLAVVVIVRWIRQTREEMAELPRELND